MSSTLQLHSAYASDRAVHADSVSAADDDLNDVVSDVVRVSRYQQVPENDGLHLAASLSHRLILAISALERDGWSRDEIVQRLHSVRGIHAESPFIRRLQEWPRGYAGDFETVEYILEQRNLAAPGRLSYWLEQYALDSAIAQQHRNKVDLQARAILDGVMASSAGTCAADPRVLILAAGGSPDLRQIQSLLTGQRFHAILLDQDADALAFSADRLTLIRERLSFITRNVVRGLRDVQRLGPFQLVLAGGLFDYLPDRLATMVLRHARERLLDTGGRLVFTNIARQNPFRSWIEYLAEWRLIHRAETDVRALCLEAGFSDADVSVTYDRTGLALIVRASLSAVTARCAGVRPI
jgi:hypothetical protein